MNFQECALASSSTEGAFCVLGSTATAVLSEAVWFSFVSFIEPTFKLLFYSFSFADIGVRYLASAFGDKIDFGGKGAAAKTYSLATFL